MAVPMAVTIRHISVRSQISSQLPIDAGSLAAHVEPHFKVSPQTLEMCQLKFHLIGIKSTVQPLNN